MPTAPTVATDLPPVRPFASRRRRIVSRIVMIAAAIAALSLGVAWCRQRSGTATPSYQTVAAVRGPLTMTVTTTGKVVAWNTVTVGSEVSGRIHKILVTDNQSVTKGQPIAELDPEMFRAQLAQGRAAVAQARAQLQQARATDREAARARARDVALFDRGVVSEQSRDAAIAASERAEAAVALALANLRQAQATEDLATANLAKTTIRSPIDGVVLSHNIEVGQTVVAAFQAPVLFEIAEDLRVMKVEVDVDEADIGKVRAGQAARFTVAAYVDRTFDARVGVVHNAARLVDRVVTYRADLAVDNPQLELRPGMTATAEIVVGRLDDELIVPAQALRFIPEGAAVEPGPRVFVLYGAVAVATPVKVVGETETSAAVRGAIAPGAQIIANRR